MRVIVAVRIEDPDDLPTSNGFMPWQTIKCDGEGAFASALWDAGYRALAALWRAAVKEDQESE